MTICADCGYPIAHGALIVPVTRIAADGEPDTGSLDFAHRVCPKPTTAYPEALTAYPEALEWPAPH